jgi:hypothetical protein
LKKLARSFGLRDSAPLYSPRAGWSCAGAKSIARSMDKPLLPPAKSRRRIDRDVPVMICAGRSAKIVR